MLKSIEEVEQVEIDAGVVVNGVDNPNLTSVDSTEVISKAPDKAKIPEGDIDISAEEEKEVVVPEIEKDEEKVEKEEEEEIEDPAKVKDGDEPDLESSNDSKTVQKRIGKLTKSWRTAERERDAEKERRTALEKELRELKAKQFVDSRPVKTDFDTEDDYIEALTDWKIDSKLNASLEKEEVEKEKEVPAADSDFSDLDGLDEALNSGRAKYEDFDKLALNTDLVFSVAVTKMVLDTEIPEDIMYYLAQNPEESKRISSLSDIKAAREIGKLETTVGKEKVAPKVPIKKTTKAPAPIQSVRTDGVVDKDTNKMSAKEYRVWRESRK